MQKIILYYKFTPISDPEAVRLWQRTVCETLQLKGRILISSQGINGTVGGELENLKRYVRATKEFAGFKDMVFKWSDGGSNHFPKLRVRVRQELVGFGAPEEIAVNVQGVVGGGTHLTPKQVHKLVDERGHDVVFFDGRNKYEAAVGRFKGAVVPDATTSKDFIRELDSGIYDRIKEKAVVTYCTGGIRCEVISAMMKKRGFKEVYQLDGGIVTYGDAYGDDGLWEGKLYVFDGRMITQFSQKARDIGHCVHCDGRTSNFVNCAHQSCNNLVLICHLCMRTQTVCSDACAEQLSGSRPVSAESKV